MTDLLQAQEHQADQIDETKNYLIELVGEGKKFKTAEELAKGKVYADQTIDVMKKRLDELTEDYKRTREENITKAKLEELYDKITTAQLASSENTRANQDNNQPPVALKDIETLVSTKIAQAKVAEKENENLNTVKAKLIEQFGPNYQTTINSQIATLGLSSEDFHALAKKSPLALFKTLGMDVAKQEGFQAPARSSQRNDNFAPTGAPKRTWAYYQDLKRKDPMLYYDRNTAVQMSKDAVELGEAFRDGTYYVKGLHDS